MRVLLIGTGGVGTCLAVRASSRRTVSLGAAQAVPSLLLQRHQHGLAPTRLCRLGIVDRIREGTSTGGSHEYSQHKT